MIQEEESKKAILRKIRSLNEFIRQMEDLAKYHELDLTNERIYLLACAQRKFLRDLLGGKI